MYRLLDRTGIDAKIRPGCVIAWHPESFSISISPEYKKDDSLSFLSASFLWGLKREDKRAVHFIRSVQDFKDFVEVLAETRGLSTRLKKEDNDIVIIKFLK